MKSISARALILAIGLGVIGAGSVLAAGSADDLISARQAEMKVNMKAMKALVAILKGESAYDAAAVQAAVKSMKDARAEGEAQDVWNASAQTGSSVKTEAKPEVWSDAAGFAAAWKSFDDAVAGVEASTDEASFKAAFPALGASCKGCHEKYRAAD
ncbi:c-type cytochrome [Aestuariivirga sp.]|jgi:cytochrome c556|uniref:c-type cytochrome n=1 Tax=Aestuariivirga sp. TaxID=2650926 RepID=UPI0037852A50